MTGSSVQSPGGVGAASTSLSLLARAQDRDEAAWTRLVSLYTPLVERWCRRASLPHDAVEDVSQNVFVAVASYLATFSHDRGQGSFRKWLRTIARTKIADYWRTHPPGTEPTGGSDAYGFLVEIPDQAVDEWLDSPDSEEAGLVYRRALELIVTDFEERSWQAFWRVVVEDQRPTEVARDLGITPNAVYLAKARVLARLREEFTGLLDS